MHLWDVATGREKASLKGQATRLSSVVFSPDGRTLAVGTDRAILLWDMARGTEPRELPRRSVLNLVFSSDGRTLAAWAANTISLWDVKTGQPLQRPQGHEGEVTTVAFSPDGKTLASASVHDATVLLWEANTGKPLHVLRGHGGSISCLVFSPDGKTLVSGGDDSTLRLWEVATGQELRLYRINDPKRREDRHQVLALGVTADGKTVVARSADYSGCNKFTIKAWDIATGKELINRHEQEADSFVAVFWPSVFSPDGKTIDVIRNKVLASDGLLFLWYFCGECDAALHRLLISYNVY
jgi:WD40 repeat protein